jgi:hypothetical protein
MTLAAEMGKPIRLINSILSTHPIDAATDSVVDAVRVVLRRCTSISYRDPVSLTLHCELFPEVDAKWCPDALFAWAPDAQRLAGDAAHGLTFGPSTEGLTPEVQQLVGSGHPYVVVSGSSAPLEPGGRDLRAAGLRGLMHGLRDSGVEPLVIATCPGDAWMQPVASEEGVPVVSADVPLTAGLFALSRAQCFVSGRYHPSILASLVGTPIVLMDSNSHKTASLQHVLRIPDPVTLPFLSQTDDVEPVLALARDRANDSEASRAARRALCEELASEVRFL